MHANYYFLWCRLINSCAGDTELSVQLYPVIADHFIKAKNGKNAIRFLELAAKHFFKVHSWSEATSMLELLLFIDDDRSLSHRRVKWHGMLAASTHHLGLQNVAIHQVS